jgi:anti-sigma B factor antagonist
MIWDLARRTARRCGRPLVRVVTGHGGGGSLGAARRGAGGQGHQPGTGGGVQPFHLESITAGGDCAVLRIDGEIDAYAAPQIRERVLDLARNGTVHVIADLRGAGFLDSAGLGALVGSRTGLRARGGSLTLVASTDRILQVLRITGLSDAFAVHSCVLDAITADQRWQAAVAGEGDSTEEWCRKHRLL